MSVNLETSYLGMTLSSPLVVAASPLGRRVATLRRLEEAGAAAVVLPSLFEEQIEHDSYQVQAALESGAGHLPGGGPRLPARGGRGVRQNGSERYLALLAEARAGPAASRSSPASTASPPGAGWSTPARWRRPGRRPWS